MIYQDLDGCLVDFERGVQDATGKLPHEFSNIGHMWKQLARTPDFYTFLEWMPDGKELWEYVKKYNPTPLTGKPWGNWATGQKKVWCGRELGWHIPVIVCWTRDKHLHCNPGDILIDDRIKTKPAWEDAGGIFIHHLSTKETIKQLKKLGYE